MNTITLSGSFRLGLKRAATWAGLLCAGLAAGHAAVPNLTIAGSKVYGTGTAVETADQTILTSGSVQLNPGSQVTFTAGTRITLTAGFWAKEGSVFHTGLVGLPADSDGDGMPDYWENQYGLNPNSLADASQDSNGNGFTNLQEYQAGTNPLPTTIAYEVRFDTNQRHQVTAIKSASNAVLASYTYYSDTRRQGRWLANNTKTDYNYDGAGRMTYLHNYRVPEGSWIQKQEYGYDLRDRRTWTQRDGNLGDTYGYQADSQLVDFKLNASNPQGTPSGWSQQIAYAYDAAGNRATVTNNGAVTTYGVDHANQYTTVTGATIQHGDGRGNVTQWNDWSYTYDADNRMLSATKPGTTITFAYDANGRLAKRTTNGQIEFFYYDGVQQLVRTNQQGALLGSTIWGPNPDEVLIDSTPQNGNRYFHSDIQGNTLAVTDDNRTIIERYRYDPYGNTSFFDASWNARSDTLYNVRFLYTGQERMPSAGGLYNYKNRFYSPELGRFLQSDPLRLGAGDFNLYRYCQNDPIDLTDPDGQELRALAATPSYHIPSEMKALGAANMAMLGTANAINSINDGASMANGLFHNLSSNSSLSFGFKVSSETPVIRLNVGADITPWERTLYQDGSPPKRTTSVEASAKLSSEDGGVSIGRSIGYQWSTQGGVKTRGPTGDYKFGAGDTKVDTKGNLSFSMTALVFKVGAKTNYIKAQQPKYQVIIIPTWTPNYLPYTSREKSK